MTIEPIARLAIKSFKGNQLAPLLVVFQMPPHTLPAHMILVIGRMDNNGAYPTANIAGSHPDPGIRIDASQLLEWSDAQSGPGPGAGIEGHLFFLLQRMEQSVFGNMPFSSRIDRARNSAAARW